MTFDRARQLYLLLRGNQRLEMRRHPLLEQNRVVRMIIYVCVAGWALYLFLFGIAFSFAGEGTPYESFDIINGGMLWFLIVDFYMRYGMQETPAQELRPYKFLPIPTNFLLNTFLLRIGLCGYNLFWFFMLVPFSMLSVVKFYGFMGAIGLLLGWWLMFVLNSYWYLLWRGLCHRRTLLVAIPTALYAALVYGGYFLGESPSPLFVALAQLGRAFCHWHPLAFLAPLVCITALFFVNRRLQRNCIYDEIARSEDESIAHRMELSILEHFGAIGEYLKLEIKSVMRNRTVRKQFLSGLVFTLILCAIFSFTDLYDGMPFMKTFICVYCFACHGTMTLTGIMGVEANYIDLLMSRKASIYAMLRAKDLFHCILLIVPMACILMPIAQGKVQLLEALSCMLFASGCIFPFLFQLALYNDHAMPLNEQVTRRSSNSRRQLLFASIALFAPMLLMRLLILVFDAQISASIMLALGLVGTASYPLWLRNVYRRYMRRHYQLMETYRLKAS